MSESSLSSSALFIETESGYRSATAGEVIAHARTILKRRVHRGQMLNTPAAAREFLQMLLVEREHEVFVVMLLNTRNRHLATVELFRGTINGASVHPREVVKEALKHNAAAVIFAHNHPSGVAEPSQADELITKALTSALALIDVTVLDHLVIGDDTVVSFRERGLI